MPKKARSTKSRGCTVQAPSHRSATSNALQALRTLHPRREPRHRRPADAPVWLEFPADGSIERSISCSARSLVERARRDDGRPGSQRPRGIWYDTGRRALTAKRRPHRARRLPVLVRAARSSPTARSSSRPAKPEGRSSSWLPGSDAGSLYMTTESRQVPRRVFCDRPSRCQTAGKHHVKTSRRGSSRRVPVDRRRRSRRGSAEAGHRRRTSR